MTKLLTLLLTLLALIGCEQSSIKQSYLCDGTIKITTLIKNNTLSLIMHNKTYYLTRERSASGEKFTNKQILFWQKGNESMLIKAGNKYHCGLIKSP
ncbi:MliC family protein [Pseudoalteromonas sp. MMG010]|uniref:MliC family protein n=1 Tax=Pseudoalteromonas sp. MMG010 TaxID=2822685 RepID=UPI001B3A38BA|nr:MliC family protein [Pseudoalteromonas sp. MMG010]MBQ4834113.1 MliC family protein [Pseudoalteromonas sp. MMG010]